MSILSMMGNRRDNDFNQCDRDRLVWTEAVWSTGSIGSDSNMSFNRGRP